MITNFNLFVQFLFREWISLNSKPGKENENLTELPPQIYIFRSQERKMKTWHNYHHRYTCFTNILFKHPREWLALSPTNISCPLLDIFIHKVILSMLFSMIKFFKNLFSELLKVVYQCFLYIDAENNGQEWGRKEDKGKEGRKVTITFNIGY